MKNNLEKKLSMISKVAKEVAERVNVVEAQKIELEVATSIHISYLKTDLFDTNKEVEINQASLQRLWEEKEKLKKKLEEAKKKAVEEYKSFDDFLDDVAEGSVSAFHERFKDFQGEGALPRC